MIMTKHPTISKHPFIIELTIFKTFFDELLHNKHKINKSNNKVIYYLY